MQIRFFPQIKKLPFERLTFFRGDRIKQKQPLFKARLPVANGQTNRVIKSLKNSPVNPGLFFIKIYILFMPPSELHSRQRAP
jgi:hypothetical protein